MKALYDRLSPEQQEEFWTELRTAMRWRGRDGSEHRMTASERGPCRCHACDFIRWLDGALEKHGICVEEYT